MKIVLNVCFGGFGLSNEATIKYAELKGIKLYTKKEKSWLTEFYTDPLMSDESFYYPDIPRDDPDLIEVVASMGDKANGRYAELKIVDIPDDVVWTIMEHAGVEWVAEAHRTWS